MLVNLSVIFSNVEPAMGEAATVVVQRIAIAIELALAAWVAWTTPRRTLAVATAAS
jgi:hypothetical protein